MLVMSFIYHKIKSLHVQFISALQGFGVSSYISGDLHNSENFWCKVHSFVFSLSN